MQLLLYSDNDVYIYRKNPVFGLQEQQIEAEDCWFQSLPSIHSALSSAFSWASSSAAQGIWGRVIYMFSNLGSHFNLFLFALLFHVAGTVIYMHCGLIVLTTENQHWPVRKTSETDSSVAIKQVIIPCQPSSIVSAFEHLSLTGSGCSATKHQHSVHNTFYMLEDRKCWLKSLLRLTARPLTACLVETVPPMVAFGCKDECSKRIRSNTC